MSDTPRDRAVSLGSHAYGASWHPNVVAEAPGRLELLGNHVDYNGGLVLAGAVDRVLAIASDPNGSPRLVQLVAGDVSSEVLSLEIESRRDWRRQLGESGGPASYTSGVIAALLAHGHPVNDGMRLAITGSVPLGFGMSSSAALCVALVLTLGGGDIGDREIVTLAREAEHRRGSPVGAMDQSASVAGGIILFDGATTSSTPIHPELGDLVFAVADSGVEHELSTSSYPRRVEESAEALRVLRQAAFPELGSLGQLSPADWTTSRERDVDGLTSTLRKRVDHVVSEVDRVRDGVSAVERSDWAAFGALMTASGHSSNVNYEISHPLVEELVARMNALDGVLGARMMGGGEGGPALALMHRDAVPDVRAVLERDFFQRHVSHLEGDRLQACAFGPGAWLTRLP
ncbi:MAG TPA: galactokinase family protein [Thermomicrobiales bacterium]|nr:galactokinase family protein [Thermomicrobiales bacterium]